MKAVTVLISICFLFICTANAQFVADAKNAPKIATATGSTNGSTSAKTATKTTYKSNAKTASKKNKFDADRSLTKANNSVDHANKTANNATDLLSSTADKAKVLVHKVGAMIPVKHSAGGAGNTTEITVKGLNFSTLSRLNDNVQSCAGVQSSKMKFNGSKSTLTVTHSGTTADLLKQIESKSKDIFSDDNVSDFKEGKVYIKLK